MKTGKISMNRKASKPSWSRKDRKLFRLNLALYQAHPGEPAHQKIGLRHRKAS